MQDVDNSQDTLQAEDITDRIEELEDERDSLQEEVDEAQTAYNERDESDGDKEESDLGDALAGARMALRNWEDDDAGELAGLVEFMEDFKGYGGDHQWRGDWYPGSFIRDSYFKEAMDELLEDIGDLPKDIPSYLSIKVDYDALQMDYTSGELEGVTYWGR